MNIQFLKQSVSMHEVLGMYGLQANRAGFIRCPFHEEKTPSMKIYPDGFYCFGCGAHGDQVDFVRTMEGCSFREAAAMLGGHDDPRGEDSSRAIRQRREEAAKKDREKAEARRAYLEACNLLHAVEDVRNRHEVGSEMWMAAVAEIPQLENDADQKLEALWARM